jgi:hypothetical protein
MTPGPGRTALGLLLAIGLVVACGSPAPSAPDIETALPSQPGSVAACALAPDLAAIVGREPIASPSSYRLGANERCLWVYGNDPSRYVGLTVGPAATHDETIASYGEGEPVGDLGDDARWWQGTRTISVLAGNRAFQVDFQLDEGDGTRELAVALARHALDRLP